MTNKTFATTIITVVLVATCWLGLLVGGRTDVVQAAQCWEPGCCGYSLVFNQWSCQSAQNYQMCYDMGEQPAWVCSNGGVHTYPDQCAAACSGGTCQQDCPISGWGNTCAITSGTEDCSHPNATTCTATVYAQQCSWVGGAVNDCTQYTGSVGDLRQCWVSGSATPTPGPNPTPGGSPPPPPGPANAVLETVVQVWLDANGTGVKEPGESFVSMPMTININIPGQGTFAYSYPSATNYNMVEDGAFALLRTQDGGACNDNGDCYGTPVAGNQPSEPNWCRCKPPWSVGNGLFWQQLGLGDTDSGAYTGSYLNTTLGLGGPSTCNVNLTYTVIPPAGYVATKAKKYVHGGWQIQDGNSISFNAVPRNTQPACSANWWDVRTPIVMFGIAPESSSPPTTLA